MTDERKGNPGGAPAGSALTSEQLERTLSDPRSRAAVRFTLTVSGGLPGEFAPVALTVDGSGEVRFSRGQREQLEEAPERSARVDEGAVRDLFALIHADDFAAASERRVPIPPDSLVGVLEVEAAGAREQIVFMADEEQAKTAGFRLPERLARLIGRMTAIGEETVVPEESLLGSR
jgi:hypothetical protein